MMTVNKEVNIMRIENIQQSRLINKSIYEGKLGTKPYRLDDAFLNPKPYRNINDEAYKEKIKELAIEQERKRAATGEFTDMDQNARNTLIGQYAAKVSPDRKAIAEKGLKEIDNSVRKEATIIPQSEEDDNTISLLDLLKFFFNGEDLPSVKNFTIKRGSLDVANFKDATGLEVLHYDRYGWSPILTPKESARIKEATKIYEDASRRERTNIKIEKRLERAKMKAVEAKKRGGVDILI